ncbi:MAG: aquaporin [Candidatus Micrarchaeota archaeon]|nr:aquaporin [Candidatus Micrarchaeota archaeon]
MAKIAGIGERALVEAVGVFFLTFIGAGSVIAAQFAGLGSSSLLVIALANGLALALAVSFAMNISGGHINPAVTIATVVNKSMKIGDAAIYIVAQLIGALVAGFLLVSIYPAVAGSAVNYGTPSLGASIGVSQGILFESVMTFILVFTIMGTVVDRRAPKIAGFGVGLAVVIDVLAGGPFTGAAMNPARWFGPAIASGFLANWYVYIIGPLAGAIVAGLLYKYLIFKQK